MSDVPATSAAEPAAPTEPQERTVPYERFQQKNEEAKAAAEANKDLLARLEDLEAQGQSETERERKQRERAEKALADTQAELQAREERLARMEKGGWVRNAAAQAGFANPDDAVAFADLDGLESERDADKAIKKLSEQRPYLLRQETPGSQLGQVLNQGQVPGQAPEQTDEGEQFVNDLKAALRGNRTSVPGLLDE